MQSRNGDAYEKEQRDSKRVAGLHVIAPFSRTSIASVTYKCKLIQCDLFPVDQLAATKLVDCHISLSIRNLLAIPSDSHIVLHLFINVLPVTGNNRSARSFVRDLWSISKLEYLPDLGKTDFGAVSRRWITHSCVHAIRGRKSLGTVAGCVSRDGRVSLQPTDRRSSCPYADRSPYPLAWCARMAQNDLRRDRTCHTGAQDIYLACPSSTARRVRAMEGNENRPNSGQS